MDCEDVDSYLFELSRMLTQSASDDYGLGKDEITVLNLLKKHRDLEDEFHKYRQVVQSVHEQAAGLPGLKQLELGGEDAGEDGDRLAGVLEQVCEEEVEAGLAHVKWGGWFEHMLSLAATH